MKYNQFILKATVWMYPGTASWHFVTIPKATSKEIDHGFSDRKRGWGSLPVIVTAGSTIWDTSIFADKKTESYLLPLKAEVRRKEGIFADNDIKLLLEIKV